MDIRHSFLSYKILRPYFSARAFTHVPDLDALNLALHIWLALDGTKDKKRHIGQRKA